MQTYEQRHTRIYIHTLTLRHTHNHNTLWLTVKRIMLQTNQFLLSKMITWKTTVFYDLCQLPYVITIIYVFSAQNLM